ncbi:MAG: hypothetical protein GX643_02940 [Acidimicrobiales bacterium]|nr:hypothetical protein [Acidimicrobiales bacterium]
MGRLRTSTLRSTVALILVCGVASCGSDPDDAAVLASFESRVPVETLEDVVTYSDAAVLARLTSQREGTSEPDEGGYTPAVNTFEFIDWVWDPGRMELGESFEMEGLGWVGGHAKRPMIVENVPRMEVGEVYVLLPAPEADGALDAPSPDGYLPIVDGKAVVSGDDPQDFKRRVAGLTIDEIKHLLEGAQPHAEAAPYLERAPEARWEATEAETAGS